jgi:DNA-binding NtrC family response regulator
VIAKIRLLLVDDERQFVEVMTQRLARRGFDVIGASSGREALDRLAADAGVDVVLLDVKMPGMNGIEATRRIKQAHPLLEIVILTGHAAIDSAVEAIRHGAYDYLMKPADLDELIAKVKQAAGRKEARENRILEIRMRPYLSDRERAHLIAEVLNV